MMQRIALIGSAGSGKSTMAVQLGQRLGLPVYHLDRLFWRPGWVPMPKPEFLQVQKQLAGGDRWIIDGNYDSSLPIRLTAADTIIFLDLPPILCALRVLRRAIRNRPRDDLDEGCRERPFTKDFAKFLLWILRYRRDNRPRVLRFLSEHGTGKTVHHLQSRSAIFLYLREHA